MVPVYSGVFVLYGCKLVPVYSGGGCYTGVKITRDIWSQTKGLSGDTGGPAWMARKQLQMDKKALIDKFPKSFWPEGLRKSKGEFLICF